MTDEPARLSGRARVLIGVAILVVFAVILGVKLAAPQTPAGAPAEAAVKPSQVRDDPVAAYDAALSAGKPVYVLFHSLTCDPCIEISAVADQVIPEYTDTVTFVNAITDDPAGQQLAARFSFEYIPTSFFVLPDGTVADSYTGVLAAEEMRARLDALVAK
ncbi:MAG: thioredoxin family protein [Actinomycetia bacterium]|nr:thioredoxin family protein [Actinomycetes bacterium]